MTTATLERLSSVGLKNIPLGMRDATRWNVWRSEMRDGKPTKVPYSVMSGERASSTRIEEWTTFPEAAAFLFNGRRHDGLAFCLGDGWAGVDLDGCRNPDTGTLHPKAAAIIDRLQSYTEVSPSGEGVKIFLRGSLPPGRRKIEAVFGTGEHTGIEMYDSGRYFCVTGRVL